MSIRVIAAVVGVSPPGAARPLDIYTEAAATM